MLPKHAHKDDISWIKEQLSKLPVAYRTKAVKGYDAAYEEAFDAESLEHKKENRARFAANTRLRRYVERVLAI